jgi:hypothetical protein
MRPLNRPMFRYGGPIKEGVMSGIREPRQNYQSGQLVRPGPGRPGYQGNPYSTNYNLIDWKNANKPYKPINIQSISEVGSSPSNATKIQRVKNLLKSPKFSERGIYGAFKKYIPKAWGAIKTGTKSGLQRFPLITTGVAGEYLTRPRDIDKLVYEQEDYGPWEGRLRKILDPTYNKKWIEAAKKYDFDKKSALGKDEKDKVTETNPWKEKYEALVEENKVPQKTDAEKRAERIQKYRDIMDIKGMNKEAAYDSLIAASKAVGESGDFKGDIKSGKLINEIIQSTSKAFDKPKKTRDAIDTLILKGEIEKDIKASDPSNAQLNALRVMQGKKLQRELNPSFDNLKAAFAKDNKGQSGIELAAGAYSKNNDQIFRGPLITKKDFKKILSDLKKDPNTKDVDEVSIIKTWTQGELDSSQKNIPDGNYTVGDKIVTIKDKQVVDVN